MIKKWIVQEFIEKNIPAYITGLAALVASSVLSMIIPKMLGAITDRLSVKSALAGDIWRMALNMLLMSLALFGLKFVFRIFIIGKARDLECFLRAKLFEKLQILSPTFYNQHKTGDLMSYVINDLGAVRMAFAIGIVFLVDGVLINVVSLGIMFQTINPYLTALAVLPIIFSVFVILALKGPIRVRFTVVQESFADLSDRIQENISGIRVIKSYAQEPFEIAKLESSSNRRITAQLNYVKISALLGPAVNALFGLSFALTLAVGGEYVRAGVITLGDFIAFNTYLGLLVAPITNFGRVVETWQKAFASMKRLDGIFTAPVEILIDSGIPEGEKMRGAVEIKNLTYSYPGYESEALRDINISVPSGGTLAIAGRTGSGKSTLVNLLTRMYKIEDGHIFIDGIDINRLNLSDLRENIGYVPQDNFLFSTTIKVNIKFFKEAFSDTDVFSAAQTASVYDAAMSFPEGFETVVGERGVTLSGGQKQRVSMARAVIKEPAVLILDDSMSAVDAKTEKEILKSIKEVLRGRTGILISHRISTISHADEIVMLNKGRIIERGTHAQLLKLKGEYWKLSAAQGVLADSYSEK
ncbi:MAG: ABC transporter ATP-binding protein/permease [Clostridiales bacterium]|jgi:ATP-binding cassette subfamily B protein|nr:ABC transporter ATP-binding protein/permease [Clostridiales bacterium]